MKTITTNGKRILVVVFEEYKNIAGLVGNSLYYWTETCTQSMGDYPYSITLPPGNWRILGLSNELTEEKIKEVCAFNEIAAYGIDEHKGGYLCYVRGYWYHKTFQGSYASFLSANKIEPNELLLIEDI